VDGRLSGHDAEKNRISICIPAEAQRRAGTQEPHAHSGPTNVIPAKAGIQTSTKAGSLNRTTMKAPIYTYAKITYYCRYQTEQSNPPSVFIDILICFG